MPEPLRLRRADINHRMMNVGRTSRTELRHAHPTILGEMSGHNLVCVLDLAARRNLHSLRHLDDNAWRGNAPPFGPLFCWRRITRLPGRRIRPGPGRDRAD